jgi:aspartate kinase
MDQVTKANIPVRLKNVFAPDGRGTVVYQSLSPCSTPTSDVSSEGNSGPSDVFLLANGYYGSARSRRVPTAITVKESILVINIRSNRKAISHDFIASVFSTLCRHKVTVDLVTTSEVCVSLAIHDPENREDLVDVERILSEHGMVNFMMFMTSIS